mgnify:CR=1 FL=1
MARRVEFWSKGEFPGLRSRLGYRQMQEIPKQKKEVVFLWSSTIFYNNKLTFRFKSGEQRRKYTISQPLPRALHGIILFLLSFSVLVQKNILIVT